jgi:hypothetical protein
MYLQERAHTSHSYKFGIKTPYNVMVKHDAGQTIIFHKKPDSVPCMSTLGSVSNVITRTFYTENENKPYIYSEIKFKGTYSPLKKQHIGTDFVDWLAQDQYSIIKSNACVVRSRSTDFFMSNDTGFGTKKYLRTNPWHITRTKVNVLIALASEAVWLEKYGFVTADDIKKLAKKYYEFGLVSSEQEFIDKYNKVETIIHNLFPDAHIYQQPNFISNTIL